MLGSGARPVRASVTVTGTMAPVAVLPLWVSAAGALAVPVKVKLPDGATLVVTSSRTGRVAVTVSLKVLEVAFVSAVLAGRYTAVSGSAPVP